MMITGCDLHTRYPAVHRPVHRKTKHGAQLPCIPDFDTKVLSPADSPPQLLSLVK
jgi:hypothetical protein